MKRREDSQKKHLKVANTYRRKQKGLKLILSQLQSSQQGHPKPGDTKTKNVLEKKRKELTERDVFEDIQQSQSNKSLQVSRCSILQSGAL